MKNKEKKQPFFTPKRKGIAALICLVAVVLWLILWQIFPMPFYSLFFASMAGSNLLLCLLAAVISFPADFIVSKALKTDIPAIVYLIINIICMTGTIYLYSIFRYTNVVLVILGAAVHIIAAVILFVISMRKENKRSAANMLRAVGAAICTTAVTDSLYLLMFTALLNIFRE